MKLMSKHLIVVLFLIQTGTYAGTSMSDLFNKYSSIKQAPPEVSEQEDGKSSTANTTPSKNSSDIHIKAPRYVENPDVIPITINLDKSIKDGDTLTMYDPKGVVVFKLEPALDTTINHVSTRFRLMSGGNSKLVIERRGGASSEYKYVDQVDSDSYASIPSMASDENDIDAYKEKPKSNSIKMLFANSMSREGYISSAVIESSNGPVKITMTPLLAEHPYFKLMGDIPNPSVQAIELSNVRYDKY
jgi:predicted secreted protein